MLLEVSHLRITVPTRHGPLVAVRDVGFALPAGGALGLIGESGCGKSLTALALMGLLPEGAQMQGSIRLNGQELIGLPDKALRRIRGDDIAMVFQEPMTALNPVHTIGEQVAEPLRLHHRLSREAARAEAIALLERVGIAQAQRRYGAYPHEFSGGQRQRITIAMALACGPDVLIADEPTTALDVTLQRQILELIHGLADERSMALLLISHDLGLIAHNVQNMLVMYGGTVVESGPTNEVFAHMAHPYTRGLMAARPRWGAAHRPGQRLATIAGAVPSLAQMPPGCPFAGRCPHTQPACATQTPPLHTLAPPATPGAPPHAARCLYPQVLQDG